MSWSKVGKDCTWWREGFTVTMVLARITKKMDLKKFDEARRDPWDVDGFKFKLLNADVMVHGDEIEEQLWYESGFEGR